MSDTHATLRLRRELVEAARDEAELFGRSTAAQIEHWARLGRAFEGPSGAPRPSGCGRRCGAGCPSKP